jgi:hypothetical protein
MTAKNLQRQVQKKKQIPRGNDRKKSKGKGDKSLEGSDT